MLASHQETLMTVCTGKKTTTKRAPRKRKSNTAVRPESQEPIELQIEGELRYKLKAAHLGWQAAESRVLAATQPEIQRILQRARRNDAEWKRLQQERVDAFNEVIDAMTPGLPDGFAIKHLDAVESTVKAIYDPASRGEHVGG